MKTKNIIVSPKIVNLFLILPVIILLLFSISSCAAKKKATSLNSEVTPSQQVTPTPVITGQKEGDAFVVVEEMPMFPGGDEALLKFIGANTRYPLEAKNKNITGRVIVRFMVKDDGTVSDVTVLRGVDPLLDNESIRVVSSLPKFTPGKQGGVSVPVWYMVPITFALDGSSPQRSSRYEVTGTDTIYSYTNVPPEFPGGSDALKQFKTKNIKYPVEAKRLGIEGVVFVRLLIDKSGSVTNATILQGVSPSIDKEVLRVAKLMPKWQPGKENGKPVKFRFTTSFEFLLTPRIPQTVDENTPFVVVQEMPMFPGGDAALLEYIAKNTIYPEKAKANKIEGRVIVRFCVTDIGGVDQVSILRGVDPELDKEAIRVVKTLPKFNPGRQGGKAVPVWYMVPVTFGNVKPAEQTAAGLPPKAPSPPPPPQGYDEVPVFKGGEKAINKFINSKLIYPKAAKEKNISGKVIVRFSINKDGSVGDVSVSSGINPELSAEAIRVVKLLPSWKPAKLAGIPVRVLYSFPVTFSIK